MKRGPVGLLLASAALGAEVHGAGGWRYAGWGMTLKEAAQRTGNSTRKLNAGRRNDNDS